MKRRCSLRRILVSLLFFCYASLLFMTYSLYHHHYHHHQQEEDDYDYYYFWTTQQQQQQQQQQQSSSPNTTLALLSPPGLLGGYRNQVLRWIAFVAYAEKHEFQQIYLPSILWSTQVVVVVNNNNNNNKTTTTKWYPVPMEWVFDIDYWNQFHPHVPLLISELKQHSDCWVLPNNYNNYNTTLHPLQQAALERGYLQPLQNITPLVQQGLLQVNPRQQDFLSHVRHCQYPAVYGGGTKSGRLWNDYLEISRHNNNNNNNNEWIYRALRPAPQWRTLALQQCIPPDNSHYYAVVHARIEIEMMQHICGRDMERNLTRILQQVTTVLEEHYPHVTSLVVAVSRMGMMTPTPTTTTTTTAFEQHALSNLETLNRIVKEGWVMGSGRRLQVVECGERLLQEYYASHPNVVDHGSLLHSVVNFDLAVHADVFIGVRSSSYSTDVLTSRYYLGKGEHNYRYTKTGQVEKVEGLPEPHSNCGKKKKKKKKK